MRRVIFILGVSCALMLPVNLHAGPWTTTLVDGASSTGWNPSIAIDGNGYAGIAYRSHSMNAPRYAYYDGSTWQLSTVPTFYGNCPSLAFDSGNHPGISCFGNDGFSSGLVYAHHDGSAWHTEIAEKGNYTGFPSSLAMDKNDLPCISYLRSDTGALRYAHYDGSSWQTATVDSSVGSTFQSRVAVASGGNPRIAYSYQSVSREMWYASYDGTSWSSSYIGPGVNIGFALDADNHPHISYSGIGAGNQGLRYTSFDGSQWHDELVDSSYDVGSTSLCLDALDQPHIAYWADMGGPYPHHGIKYASRVGGIWQLDSVVRMDATSTSFSLALDSSGDPYIAYLDGPSKTLYVATLVPEPGTLVLGISGIIGLGAFLCPWKRAG